MYCSKSQSVFGVLSQFVIFYFSETQTGSSTDRKWCFPEHKLQSVKVFICHLCPDRQSRSTGDLMQRQQFRDNTIITKNVKENTIHKVVIQDCLRKLEYCDKVLYFL